MVIDGANDFTNVVNENTNAYYSQHANQTIKLKIERKKRRTEAANNSDLKPRINRSNEKASSARSNQKPSSARSKLFLFEYNSNRTSWHPDFSTSNINIAWTNRFERLQKHLKEQFNIYNTAFNGVSIFYDSESNDRNSIVNIANIKQLKEDTIQLCWELLEQTPNAKVMYFTLADYHDSSVSLRKIAVFSDQSTHPPFARLNDDEKQEFLFEDLVHKTELKWSDKDWEWNFKQLVCAVKEMIGNNDNSNDLSCFTMYFVKYIHLNRMISVENGFKAFISWITPGSSVTFVTKCRLKNKYEIRSASDLKKYVTANKTDSSQPICVFVEINKFVFIKYESHTYKWIPKTVWNGNNSTTIDVESLKDEILSYFGLEFNKAWRKVELCRKDGQLVDSVDNKSPFPEITVIVNVCVLFLCVAHVFHAFLSFKYIVC